MAEPKYILVDCDECSGTGRMRIDEGSEMNQLGWPVGHHVCDRCGGIGKFRCLTPDIWLSLPLLEQRFIWIDKLTAAGRAMLDRLEELGDSREQWLDVWPWLRDDEDWGEDWPDDEEEEED
jgi:hypothetical protein